MSDFPRRSPRLSQQAQQFQPQQSTSTSLPSYPAFSQTSSAATTLSYPSPNNDNLNVQQQPQRPTLQIPTQFAHSTAAAPFTAPLPSPSASKTEPFFKHSQPEQFASMGRQEQQNGLAQGQYNTFGSQYAQQQAQNNNAQHHNSFSQSGRPALHHSTSEQMPPGLPPNFLAEAAKRAQMACLMRDLGDVSL